MPCSPGCSQSPRGAPALFCPHTPAFPLPVHSPGRSEWATVMLWGLRGLRGL